MGPREFRGELPQSLHSNLHEDAKKNPRPLRGGGFVRLVSWSFSHTRNWMYGITSAVEAVVDDVFRNSWRGT
jgi:hypothetical protein